MVVIGSIRTSFRYLRATGRYLDTYRRKHKDDIFNSSVLQWPMSTLGDLLGKAPMKRPEEFLSCRPYSLLWRCQERWNSLLRSAYGVDGNASETYYRSV